MSTTAVFVELLIVGLQASVWVVLLLLSFFGREWVDSVHCILRKLGPAPVSFIFLSLAYTLGIIVDRFADGPFFLRSPGGILEKWPLIARWHKGHCADQRLEVFAEEGKLSAYTDYLKCRHRILRATTLNAVLITGSALLFVLIAYRSDIASARAIAMLVTAATGILTCVIVFLAWGLTDLVCQKRLAEAKDALDKIKKKHHT